MLAATDQVATSLGELVARRGIGLVQLLQARTDLIEVLDEEHELVIQRTGTFGDFPRILVLPLLAPEAVDYPQGGQAASIGMNSRTKSRLCNPSRRR